MDLVGILNTNFNKMNYFKNILLNKAHKSFGVTTIKREPRIIISLSTYPKRIKKVKTALEGILRQSVKPDKIVVNLAKDEIQDAPYFLEELKKYNKRGVEIRIVDDNLRPYNKLIHSLKEFPEDIIITVDDDVLYSTWFVEHLYGKFNKDPKAIVAYRYTYMLKKNDMTMSPYNEWPHPYEKNINNANLFFTGVGGVLYPPGSLNTEVLNKDLFMRLCPNNDDVWFNAMALLNGTRKLLAFDRSIGFPSIGNVEKDSLYEINVVQEQNDIQIKNVFDYYSIYRYLQ